MNRLYEHLKAKNLRGLPYDEALQLFLSIFCTTSYLPENLKNEKLGKVELSEVFTQLARDGLISLPNEEDAKAITETDHWIALVPELLLQRIELDPSFPERISHYL